MSENSEDKQAWGWYDIGTLQMRHISLVPTADHGVGYNRMIISYEHALDILTGKLKLADFEIIETEKDLVFRRRKITINRPKFWQLIDLEKRQRAETFDHIAAESSPVNITRKDHNAFVVDVIKPAKNIQFYITMRNDPSYLIKTLELYPEAASQGTTTGLVMRVDLGHDYSIYVRYDAA